MIRSAPQTTAILCAIALAAALGAPSAAAEPVRVVASIKPVHALASGVMAGVGTPHLIVRDAGSPHTFALAPSDAQALEQAQVVFWIGPSLETFLERALANLSRRATVVALEKASGVKRLALREGGGFESHDDDDADRAPAANDGKPAAARGHSHGHSHDHGEKDGHVWLDTRNAAAMVKAIERTLAKADAANAGRYRANAAALSAEFDALAREMEATLRPVAKRPFVVFHDAFQYLERQFGLKAAGSITVSPETQPGAQRIRDIRDKIRTLGATCIFAEPQFESRIVRSIADATGVRAGVLDPLGAALPDGAALYGEMMRRNAAAIRDCLSPAG